MFFAQALNMREDRLSKAAVLNGGIGNDFAPQRAVGQVWRHLGLSQVGESCYWHLVDWISGCYKTPYNAQNSPPQQELSLNNLSVVLRLRNSALTKLRLAGSIKFSGNTELKCSRLRTYILKKNKVHLDAIILPIESHPVVERILKKLVCVKLQSQAICTCWYTSTLCLSKAQVSTEDYRSHILRVLRQLSIWRPTLLSEISLQVTH